MKGGVLVYRCRRCGGENRVLHVPDVGRAVREILVNGTSPHEWGILGRGTCGHTCPDGAVGVCDLIGGEPDKGGER